MKQGLDGNSCEREAVVAFLRSEAVAAKFAQSRAEHPDKLYRMGQKDGLLLAADAIERGHHTTEATNGNEA